MCRYVFILGGEIWGWAGVDRKAIGDDPMMFCGRFEGM
jgi:hypothetical protein